MRDVTTLQTPSSLRHTVSHLRLTRLPLPPLRGWHDFEWPLTSVQSIWHKAASPPNTDRSPGDPNAHPCNMMVPSLVHMSLLPKQHVDQFSSLMCPTRTHTDHATCKVCSKKAHLAHFVQAMRPNRIAYCTVYSRPTLPVLMRHCDTVCLCKLTLVHNGSDPVGLYTT